MAVCGSRDRALTDNPGATRWLFGITLFNDCVSDLEIVSAFFKEIRHLFNRNGDRALGIPELDGVFAPTGGEDAIDGEDAFASFEC